MVFREGGAHGVYNTGASLKFCRCGMCLKKAREAMTDPANAGKTKMQLIHEKQFGQVTGTWRRGEKDANPWRDGRKDLHMETRQAAAEALATYQAMVPYQASVSAYPVAAEPGPTVQQPSPSGGAPLTLGAFIPAARVVSSKVTKSRPQPVRSGAVPRPVVPTTVAWPLQHAPNAVAAAPEAKQAPECSPLLPLPMVASMGPSLVRTVTSPTPQSSCARPGPALVRSFTANSMSPISRTTTTQSILIPASPLPGPVPISIATPLPGQQPISMSIATPMPSATPTSIVRTDTAQSGDGDWLLV